MRDNVYHPCADSTTMDTESAFEDIRKDIIEGRGPLVGPKIVDIAEVNGDPMTRIKCLSLLKVVKDDTASKKILCMLLMDLPEDRMLLVQIAEALRGLEYPSSALSILKDMEQDDPILRMSALCLLDLE